jgi:HEAT repeat protein
MNLKETITATLTELGIDENKLKLGLEGTNVEAVQELFAQIDQLEKDPPYYDGSFVQVILPNVLQQDDSHKLHQIIEFFDLRSDDASFSVIYVLRLLGDEKAIQLLRETITSLSRMSLYAESVAHAIIDTQYKSRPQDALNDKIDLVRRVAIKRLDEEQATEFILPALKNSSTSVRSIATWYMGRQQVKEAIEPLTELIKVEDDVETLRGAIWSLGVLGAKQTLHYLHILERHIDPLISTTAREAINRIESFS